MLEMRQAVAHHDLRRHADARQVVALESRRRRGRRVGQRVDIQIEQRAGGVFDRGKALVECAGRQQPSSSAFGMARRSRRGAHSAAGSPAPPASARRAATAARRNRSPRRCRRAADRSRRTAARAARGRIRGTASARRRTTAAPARPPRLGEIADVDDDRADVADRASPGRAAGHPGAALLGGAREIIADEQADVRAARVLHLPGAHVRVIERHVWRGVKVRPNRRSAVSKAASIILSSWK